MSFGHPGALYGMSNIAKPVEQTEPTATKSLGKLWTPRENTAKSGVELGYKTKVPTGR